MTAVPGRVASSGLCHPFPFSIFLPFLVPTFSLLPLSRSLPLFPPSPGSTPPEGGADKQVPARCLGQTLKAVGELPARFIH